MHDVFDRFNFRPQMKMSPNGHGIIKHLEIPLLSIARQATATAIHAGSGGHPVFAVVGGTNTPPTVLRFSSGQAAIGITQVEVPCDYDAAENNPTNAKWAEGDHFKVILTAAGSATPRDMTVGVGGVRVGGTFPTIASVDQTVVGTAITRYEFDFSGNKLHPRDIVGLQLTAEGSVASNIDLYSLVIEYRGLIVNADESNR